MVTIDIKSVQKILQKKITFGHTKCFSKKIKVFCESYLPHKNVYFFSHLHIREILQHKFTITYCFSVHAHRYHANLGKHGCLGQSGRGKVKRSL